MIKDYVNEYFKNNEGPIRPSITMNDGTTLSVQASEFHYCSPRISIPEGYFTVEVYCWPNDENEYFSEWGGDDSNPAGYVPVEVVNFYIEKHGGVFKEGE